MNFRTASLAFMMLSASSALGQIQLEKTTFEWGEKIQAQVSVVNSYGYRLEIQPRPSFEYYVDTGGYWNGSIPVLRFDLVDRDVLQDLPYTHTAGVFYDTTNLPRPKTFYADPSRNYFDLVLISKNSDYTDVEIDRKTIFVSRITPPFERERLSWSFADGEKLLPSSTIEVTVAPDAPLETTRQPPKLQIVRLGRYMPGGAIEPDHLIYANRSKGFNPVADTVELDRELTVRTRVPSSVLGEFVPVHYPRNAVMLSAADQELVLQGSVPALARAQRPIDYVSHEDSTLPSAGRYLLGVHGSQENFGYDSRFTEYVAPITIGHFEARVIGAGGAILERRRFEIVPEKAPLAGSLLLIPQSAEPYGEAPKIQVTPPQGLDSAELSDLRLSIVRVGRKNTMIDKLIDLTPFAGAIPAGEPFTYEPVGEWQSGRYQASLYSKYQNILLDRIGFDIKMPEKRGIVWPVPLEPLLDPDDVEVRVTSGTARVFGEPIAFDVVDAVNNQPLKNGPLVAELYMDGYFTYGCYWREGYYTGSGALVNGLGKGLIAAPGEAGRYQIRIFRPMDELPIEGYAGQEVTVTRPEPGQFMAPANMELVGVTSLNVIAPVSDGIISIAPYDETALGNPIEVTISNPGPSFTGHKLSLQLWRAAGTLAGGQVTSATPILGPFFAAGDSKRQTPLIDSFPFSAMTIPLGYAGNYEVRVFDMTTGLFIARQTVALRDPGPPDLPASARYESDIADDWPLEDDARRGLLTWYKPRSECAGPEFDSPPTLEIVEYVVDDASMRGDGEFRPVEHVLTGNPYFVRATFDEAPPDDEYQVRLDGERRIAIYRTPDDPRVYRSAVLHFAEQVDE